MRLAMTDVRGRLAEKISAGREYFQYAAVSHTTSRVFPFQHVGDAQKPKKLYETEK
jgi:hypothetical protein